MTSLTPLKFLSGLPIVLHALLPAIIPSPPLVAKH